MAQEARLGDTVDIYCPESATGVITGASSNVCTNGKGVARVGDEIICNVCGCSGKISSGSPSVLVNGKAAAHIGSSIEIPLDCSGNPCSGVITGGSPNVNVEG